MDPMQYLLLAFVQAATEFLPISSSGHLLFFKHLFHGQSVPIIFDIIVHVASLVAIVVFFRQELISTFRNGWAEWVEKRDQKNHFKLLVYAGLSTAVTLLLFFLFKNQIESVEQSASILFPAYLVTTLILFLTYFARHEKEKEIAQKGIFLPVVVGLFQGLAILPGISRSGLTISPLLWLGIKKDEAVFYSFLLAIPAVLGALVFKLSDLENFHYVIGHWKIILLSFVVSVFFSYCFLVLLTWIIRRGKYWLFSFYTLAMAILALVVLRSVS